MDQRLLRTATAWLRGEVAWTRLMAVARKLAVLEERYRPDQPRAPRGTPQGGQWTLVQTVSGIDLIFTVDVKYQPMFDGKVIDYAPDRAFFLR